MRTNAFIFKTETYYIYKRNERIIIAVMYTHVYNYSYTYSFSQTAIRGNISAII